MIKSMYVNTTTAVKTKDGLSEEFGVKVGVHQGSVLSPLLFTIVLEALSREFRVGLPFELLYADDLALLAESEKLLMETVNGWKLGTEENGFRVNIGKTQCLPFLADMRCLPRVGRREQSGKFSCGICKKRCRSEFNSL